ncbi:SurA N-terminal domain-containing protein [Salisediminibacterium selenitireducens]|uniref:Lipoprotein n=1 Tax=Bacillus selenitireducens (strain ATCC 700615 / DSM 15326 / MLS10) TaxID=439292 RepID=D6XX63_BACIE|nr:hypothetical protein [Salisediminibacterium selenitireducens]ADH97920.1 hypothetical protein Bsel_0380 [[Bacillus] selenitireducens MLS10]
MKRWTLGLFLIALTGCAANAEDPSYVIATLDGETITMEDYFFRYTDPSMIEEYLKERVMIKEAEDLGITVSEDEVNASRQMLFPDSDAEERLAFWEDRAFIDEQAERLDMDELAYFKEWEEKMYRSQLFVDAYVEEVFGGFPEDTDEMQALGEEIDAHIDTLFDTYQEEYRLEME